MRRAWHAYLVVDWKVGESLGGVLRRFTTFWLALFAIAAVKGFLTESLGSALFGAALGLTLLLWMYQPTKIYRSNKYSGWSVPPPSGSAIQESGRASSASGSPRSALQTPHPGELLAALRRRSRGRR